MKKLIQMLTLLLLLWSSSNVFAQVDGFGGCDVTTTARLRNDERLGRWVNPLRPGSAWDFWAGSNDGGAGTGSWSSFGWYLYDGVGDPLFLLGANPYPNASANQWTTDIDRPSVINGVSSTKTAGTITIRFRPATPSRPAGDPHRMEVEWRLYGTNTTNGNPSRISVTGMSTDTTKKECLYDTNSPTFYNYPAGSDGYVSAINMGPAPSNPYAGAWTIDSPANPKHGLVEYFARFGLDENNDLRPDWDMESEQAMFAMYDNEGAPRWLYMQDLADAVQPRNAAKSSSYPLFRVANGYCSWCPVPANFKVVAANAGSINRVFTSFLSGKFYADISTTFRNFASANYTIGSTPVANSSVSLTRNVSGRYDEGVASIPPAADPQTTTFPADAISDQVGTTAGAFNVDQSGAANYSVPFFTVPATGGMRPSLALSYSSQADVGLAGVGWSVSGLSSISRCRKTFEAGDGPGVHPPVQLTTADALCIDGQRLIQVGTGSDHVEYRTESATFSRIRRFVDTNGLHWFGVWDKNGSYREYGRDVDSQPTFSRLMANDGTTVSTTTVLSWAISRFQDAAGNYVRFEYWVNSATAGSPALGEQLISKVQYAGNAASHTAIAAGNYLSFEYADLPTIERWSGRLAGTRIERSKYLSAVKSLAYAAPGSSTEVRTYSLSYAAQATRQNLRRLITVTECGRADTGAAMTCLPSTNVSWTDGSRGHFLLSEGESAQYSASHPSWNAKMERLKDYKFGDVNGDGLQDVVWLRKLENNPSCSGTGGGNNWDAIHVHFARNAATSYERAISCISFHRDADDDRGWHLFDFNSDGRDDLLVTDWVGAFNLRWQVHLSEIVPGTDQYRFSATGISPAGLDSSGNQIRMTVGLDSEGMLVDVDGDSLPDLVTASRNTAGDETLLVWHLRRLPFQSGGQTFAYRFAESAPIEFRPDIGSTSQCVYGTQLSVVNPDKVTAVDVNGDGRSDYVFQAKLNCPNTAAREPAINGYPADPVYQAQLNPDFESPPDHLDLQFGAPDDIADGSGYQRCRMEATATLPAVTSNCIYPSSKSERIYPAEIMGDDKFWLVFTADGVEGGKKIYREYARFKSEGSGAFVSDDEDKFRVEDINGDGLADVTYKGANVNRWYTQLNLGKSVGGSRFAAQIHVKNTGDIVTGPTSGTDDLDIVNQDRVGLYDYDADGDLDYFEAQDKFKYNVYPWIGDRFSYVNRAVVNVDPFDADWARSFVDLNGDGYMDRFGVHWDDSDGEWFVSWGRRTSAGLVQYVPLDAVTAITTASMAQQQVSYAPTSFSSVYRKDFNAPTMMDSGRGSPVQDMSGGMFVVRGTKHSAPTATNKDAMSETRYRYAGAKIQGGGRGFLGFRRVETYDVERQILSQQYFATRYPFAGMLEQGESFAYAPWDDSACVSRSPTSDVNGPGAACFTAPTVCLTLGCDDPSTYRVSATTQNWEMVSMSTSGIGGTNAWATGALPINTPTTNWVRQAGGYTSTYDPIDCHNGGDCGILTSEMTTVQSSEYDAYGNLKKITVDQGDENSTIRTVQSTFQFSNDVAGSNWKIGKLLSSSVASTRNAITKTRANRFEYDTRGLVNAEVVRNGATDQRITAHTRDSFGNVTKSVTCDSSLSVVSCSALTDVAGYPSDSTTIRRIQLKDYDDMFGRFVDVASSRYRNAIAADMTVLSRNLLGQPTSVTNEVGAKTNTFYGAFGAARHVSNADGSKLTATARWCASTGRSSSVPCPYGAVFRLESAPKGTAKTWTYTDSLSRDIATMSEGFSDNQFSVSAVEFDTLGRVVTKFEPWMGPSNGASGGANLVNGQTRYFTATTYDFLDRVEFIEHANSSSTAPVTTTNTFVGMTTSTETVYPDPDIGGLQRSQSRTLYRNALGEVERSVDQLGRASCFVHDAHGNLVQMSRSLSGACAGDKVVLSTMVFDDLGRKTSLSDADMGSWSYQYNAADELVQQVSPKGACIRNRFDARGRLAWREDYRDASCTNIENTSDWHFDYTANGRLYKEKIAAPLPIQPRTNGDFSRVFSYDTLGRPTQIDTTIDGDLSQSLREYFSEKKKYDQFGRVFQTFDAKGSGTWVTLSNLPESGIYHEYNSRGFLKRLREVKPGPWGEIYYEVVGTDARGNVVEEYRGARAEEAETVPTTITGALVTRRAYDPATGRLISIRSGDKGTIDDSQPAWQFVQDMTISYDAIGNVSSRVSMIPGGSSGYNAPSAPYDAYRENFALDGLNRLDLATRLKNGVTQATEDYQYDAWGNLTQKPNPDTAGSPMTLTYASAASASVRGTDICGGAIGPHAVKNAAGRDYCYDVVGNQTQMRVGGTSTRSVTYTAVDQIRDIREYSNNKATQFSYGPNRERWKRVDFTDASATVTKRRTRYFGGAEVIDENGVWELKRNIAGVAIVTLRSNGSGTKEYVFGDHLGSTDVVTDRFGNVGTICNTNAGSTRGCREVGQRMSFDAFGARRTASTWQPMSNFSIASFNSTRTTTRGFTGHEMIDGSSLIHMNGRTYDPLIGRFIQADPTVQDPLNTQSLNRFSYVMNNPLTAVDPTGYASIGGFFQDVGNLALKLINRYQTVERVASVIYRTASQAQRNDWNLRAALPAAFSNWMGSRPLDFERFSYMGNCASIVDGCNGTGGPSLKEGCSRSTDPGCEVQLGTVEACTEDNCWRKYPAGEWTPLDYRAFKNHDLSMIFKVGYMGVIVSFVTGSNAFEAPDYSGSGRLSPSMPIFEIKGASKIAGGIGSAGSRVGAMFRPYGFASHREFLEFSKAANSQIGAAGFEDSVIYLRGSTVTGNSFKRGVVLDDVKDFDLAVTGDSVISRAKAAGIPFNRGVGSRTAVLSNAQLQSLNLDGMVTNLTGMMRRDVTIMLYDSSEAVFVRGPIWKLPQ